MRNTYFTRDTRFAEALGIKLEDLKSVLKRMYLNESMSAQEIADILKSKSGESISARSLQKMFSDMGIARSVKESFALAVSRDRVKWAYKDPRFKMRRPDIRSSGTRYRIMKRDGYKCVLCGATSATSMLEIDHIIAVCRGGSTTDDNLRTLCVTCNQGKRIEENER